MANKTTKITKDSDKESAAKKKASALPSKPKKETAVKKSAVKAVKEPAKKIVKAAAKPAAKKEPVSKPAAKVKPVKTAAAVTPAEKKTKIKIETETVDVNKQKIEQAKLEQVKLEQAKIEQARLEKEKLERTKLEKERIEKEKRAVQERARLEAERLEKERLEKEKFEKERLEREAEEERKRKELKGIIHINELITVRELAEKMKLTPGEVLKKLLSMGSLATINQRLDTDVAILLANEFKYDAKLSSIYSEESEESEKEDPATLKPRFPIVTIMGHVDHGKTSLLDSIRSSDVAGGEHGGITQHIGAYKVKTPNGGNVTFLDTPGHEAFTAMRSRGAQVTDIVVLVVSAADGVMPQTIEAINHAKAAGVPIIVAVNKIDLPTSDPQRIRQELSNYGLAPEEWGGDAIMVDISAKRRINIDSLLDMILLKAEMMELKANPDKKADGIVVEAKLDSRRGPVATLLVQHGTLRVGDNIVVGTTYGKIRAMADEHGKRFNEAPPSTPIEVLGINEPPQAGDKFVVVDHESQAREIAQSRKDKAKASSLKPRHHLSLMDISSGQTKDLKIILKADVQGSLGALSDSLERMSTNEVTLKIIHRGAGSITESDVALAVASNALIVGFNLRPDATVEKLAEKEGVSINVYRIIYDLIADVKAAMEGKLEPDTKEKILGKAVVKQVFKLSSFGTIAGCSVIDGKIQRGSKVRLLRDNVIVFEGNISSLKRMKDDVKEVEKGYECGVGLENYADIKTGDIIENFTTEKVARKLEEN